MQSQATHLVVKTQPGSIVAGNSLSLVVEVEDASGNVLSGFSGTLTVSLVGNPNGTGVLSGSLNISNANGVLTLSGFTIDQAGSGYSLQVSSPGLTAVTTSTFNVAASTATHLVVKSQPGNITAGSPST